PALSLNSAAVAPAPQVARDRMQNVPALTTQIVAPPLSVQADPGGLRLRQVGTEIIPPSVSAPVNTTSIASRLSLPQPGVIAPPPSYIAREGSSLAGSSGADFSQQIVPPPVQVTGQLSNREQVGSIAGNTSVVPPPVQVGGGLSGGRSAGTLTATNEVVPPPPVISGAASASG